MDKAISPRMPRAIWTLGFVSLLMDVSSEMIHSLLPVFLATTLGVSALTIGMIEGAAEATAQIVKVFSGALSDWWGRRKPLAVLGYGLGAAAKPLFALAHGVGLVLAARLIDRIGKGIRGAPRDALVADLAPAEIRGAAFGLRQALDTLGAFLGPLLAMALMLLLANDFRAVFWIAAMPGFLAVALLFVGIREPRREKQSHPANSVQGKNLRRLSGTYWWVVGLGALFALARFSEAFLVLRAQSGGLPLALTPLVMIVMNIVYAAAAYPFGKLADTMSHTRLLSAGLAMLFAADVALAWDGHWATTWFGVVLWGLHLAMTQGLLAAMVADSAPADLRGTAFGVFHFVNGIATLFASVLAGLLWEKLGAATTFLGGAGFCLGALGLLALAPPLRRLA